MSGHFEEYVKEGLEEVALKLEEYKLQIDN